jgi:hypothetical protein
MKYIYIYIYTSRQIAEMQVSLERPDGEHPKGECVGMLRLRFVFDFEPFLEEEDSIVDLPPALHKRTTTVYRVD